MKYILTRFQIKDGKIEETKAFLANLQKNHSTEMIEVLKESDVSLDCSFIDGDHLYIYKRLDSLETLKNKINNSKLHIYEDIRKWAEECIEERVDIESIASFDVMDI